MRDEYNLVKRIRGIILNRGKRVWDSFMVGRKWYLWRKSVWLEYSDCMVWKLEVNKVNLCRVL